MFLMRNKKKIFLIYLFYPFLSRALMCIIHLLTLYYVLALTPAPMGFQSELFTKLKRRQLTDSDIDDGLPSSPPSSLTTADVMLGVGLKVYNFCSVCRR